MSELIQQTMEAMVPELEEYLRATLFTKEEVRSIVRKRTQFEYAVRRRAPSLVDFLRYAQYEMNLDALRKKRRSRLAFRRTQSTLMTDFVIARRIQDIFERAVRRFRGELSLWLQFLEWNARTLNIKGFQRTLAQALQLHPTQPLLWIKGANYEFENNGNTPAARVLYQRGLRSCPTSQLLYLHFFRMELMYLEKLRARTRALGFMKTVAPASNEDRIDFTSGTDVVSLSVEDGEEIMGGMFEGKDEFFAGSLAKAIAEKAFRASLQAANIDSSADNESAIDEQIQFRLRFLPLIPTTSNFDALREFVYESIQSDFSHSAAAWQVLASRASNIPSAVGIYEDALSKIQVASSKALIFEHYTSYLLDKLNDECDPEGESQQNAAASLAERKKSNGRIEYLCERLSDAFAKWQTAAPMGESACLSHAQHLLRIGHHQQAIDFLNEQRSKHADWVDLITFLTQLQIKRASTTENGNLSTLLAELRTTIARAPISHALPLYLELIDLSMSKLAGCSDPKSRHQQQTSLHQVFHEGMTRLCGAAEPAARDCGAQLKSMYLQFCLSSGLSAWRTGLDRVLAIAHTPSHILTEAMLIEQRELTLAQSMQQPITSVVQRLNLLHEKCASSSTDSQVWLDYIAFLLQHNQITQVEKVYWRAIKSVDNVTEFTLRYEAMK